MILLSGGTGTPKLLAGMREVIPEDEITVIVNTAEDTIVSGNLVCPDIDTVLYLLSGAIDAAKWWGIRDDTFATHEYLKGIGHHEIMQIGDMDRATHILRSDLIRSGCMLTEAICELTRRFGIRATVLPMTDNEVATHIATPDGVMHFQEYWITHQGEPDALDVQIRGIEDAKPSDAVLAALNSDDRVVIGPSNPITSIGPIIKLQGMREILRRKRVVAISPIIDGAPVSGPAGKLMRACGYDVSSAGVLECYGDILDTVIIDQMDVGIGDETGVGGVGGVGIVRADTMMSSVDKSKTLSRVVVDAFEGLDGVC
ncbi:MAG: 2-phospho-L-lactate transferase [Candidatus Methanogasteraceae archaeon]|nr:MAG: 2-phospho-L-lactate transferase [ANME-2 cluster archaeon]